MFVCLSLCLIWTGNRAQIVLNNNARCISLGSGLLWVKIMLRPFLISILRMFIHQVWRRKYWTGFFHLGYYSKQSSITCFHWIIIIQVLWPSYWDRKQVRNQSLIGNSITNSDAELPMIRKKFTNFRQLAVKVESCVFRQVYGSRSKPINRLQRCYVEWWWFNLLKMIFCIMNSDDMLLDELPGSWR